MRKKGAKTGVVQKNLKKDMSPNATLRKIRQTPARLAILDLFEKSDRAYTIGQIHDLLKKKSLLAKVPDWATVYRNVIWLEQMNIINSFDIGDGAPRYEKKHQHNDQKHHHHHHLICSQCRRIEHLEVCQDQAIQKLAAKSGYKNVTHKLEFFGVCPSCA